MSRTPHPYNMDHSIRRAFGPAKHIWRLGRRLGRTGLIVAGLGLDDVGGSGAHDERYQRLRPEFWA